MHAQNEPEMKRNKTFRNFIFRILFNALLHIAWYSCRVKTVIGEQHAKAMLAKAQPIIPCYWHQHHVFGLYYMLQMNKQGLKLGFLISPSRDGDIPAKLAESWGMHAIRGSSNRTGALALRDLYNIVTKKGVSPIITADGPTGPVHKFKPGAVMLAQLTKSPMLPISYAASRYWQLKFWDKFIVPKPFSTIVIAIGEPRYVAKDVSLEDQEPIRQEMEDTLIQLQREAAAALQN